VRTKPGTRAKLPYRRGYLGVGLAVSASRSAPTLTVQEGLQRVRSSEGLELRTYLRERNKLVDASWNLFERSEQISHRETHMCIE